MRQDIIDNNKLVKESFEADGVVKFSDAGFKYWNKIFCVIDGKPVSPATLKYFDWDVEKVICYNCQNQNK